MAGPFRQEANPVGDIKDVRLAGGGGVAPRGGLFEAVAGGIAGAAQAGVQYLAYKEEEHKKEVLNQAGEQFSSIMEDLTMQKYPSLKGSEVAAESLNSPVVRNVAGKLDELSGAQKAGRLSPDQVLTRMNVAVNQAIAADPKYRTEIMAMARDTYGFVPSQKMAEMLLAPDPMEKALSKLAEKAAEYGVDIPTYQQMMRRKFDLDQDVKLFDYKKKVGDYNADTMASEVTAQAANTLAVLMDNTVRQIKQGGVINPEVEKARIVAAYAEARRTILTNLPPGIPASAVQANLAMLTEQQDINLRMVDSGSYQNMLKDGNELFVEVAKHDMYKLPTFNKVYALFPNAGPELYSYMTRLAKDPAAMKGFLTSSEPGAGIMNIAMMTDLVEKGNQMFRTDAGLPGFVPKDDGERRFLANWGIMVASAPNATTAEVMTAIDRLEVVTGSRPASIVAYSDKRVVASVAKHKEVWGRLINVANDERNRLINELARLKATGALPENAFTVEGGKLVDAIDLQRVKPVPGQANIASSGSVQKGYTDWVRAANRLFKFGDAYRAVGVFNNGVYKGFEAELKAMQTEADALLERGGPEEQATTVAEPSVPQPRRAIRDPITGQLRWE